MCSPNTCKDVFNPNVAIFQLNCAEDLHFSAFHFFNVLIIAREASLLVRLSARQSGPVGSDATHKCNRLNEVVQYKTACVELAFACPMLYIAFPVILRFFVC